MFRRSSATGLSATRKARAMRIGVASIALEANTFNPVATTLDDFRRGTFLMGDDIHQLAAAHHEIGGFLTELAAQGFEAVPILVAAAAPGGRVTGQAFETLRSMLHDGLAQAGPLDGMLLAPHGAMVAESVDDADGQWLDDVRGFCGRSMPIVATIDPHANLSERMVRATDAITAYRTNPHLDQRERGCEAARLICRALKDGTRLTQAACFPPLAIEIERQSTAEGPCAALLEQFAAVRQREGVLSSSLVLGFPYADVAELGSAALVVTDGDPVLAKQTADELGAVVWHRRQELRSQLMSIEEAVENVRAHPESTTCLLDMGDNVGGGSPGDGTLLLHALAQCSGLKSLVVLFDPEAAEQARQSGVGARRTFRLGGHAAGTTGVPFERELTVAAVSDGRFHESQPRHGGQMTFDQGASAALVDEAVTVIVMSRRCPPFSLGQVTHLGIDPGSFQAIVAKGVHAPVAAYAPVCDRFLRVNTPGVTAADATQFAFSSRRRPLFPFESDFHWSP